MPEGTSLIGVLRDFRDTPDTHLWQLPLGGNADTGGFRFLTNADYGFPDYPRFSPDGSMLAFRTYYGLAVITTNDQREILFDSINIGNTPPVWARDTCKNL
jgi:hypothetical protein